MLHKYKEIFYGLLFGLGAGIIDAHMHARMENTSFWIELVQPRPAMLFYRVLFICFGLVLGWLLWQKNKRLPPFGRDFREIPSRVGTAGVVAAHKTASSADPARFSALSRRSPEGIRFAYERSQEIQALSKTKLPTQSGS